jgi:ParB family transcriptional regulator, chromosome partitioning protein
MVLRLDDLDLLDADRTLLDRAPASGIPMRLAIDLIDEDPDQPRQAFDDTALAELAATIRERGVRQPVSVRTHPRNPQRWMLNFGARRLRASRLAGLTEIPTFVDQTAQSVDQFIENEQRKGLTPLEIALFVQRALKDGQTQAEIARSIGKSRQYVMTATALIDAPAWLMKAYREGRCRGLNELHEWRKLYAAHPQQIEMLIADQQPLTRERAALLRARLEQEKVNGDSAPAPPVPSASNVDSSVPASAVPSSPQPLGSMPVVLPDQRVQPEQAVDEPAPALARTTGAARAPVQPPSSPLLLARLGAEIVRVLTQTIPPESGHVFVQTGHADVPRSVDAGRLVLIGFAQG